MRRSLNITLLSLLLVLIAFMANAQAVDMNLGSPNILPNQAVFPGTSTISFTVTAETLDENLSSDDLSASFASITVTLSGLQGSQTLLPTGDGADFFNWAYNPTTNVYTGTSKDATMVGDQIYNITITNLTVTGATTAKTVGFLANLTPPGDLFNSTSVDDDAQIYTDAVLPVTLVSFNVQKEGKSALLIWATTEETNSEYFEIQHSVTGKEWAKIDRVTSHGESTTLKNYTFTHPTPVNGENLYRLKMVDKDATFAYSRIQSVKFDGIGSDLSVYPNPVTDKLFIRDFSQVTQVKINDLNGRSVYQAAGSTTGEVDVKNLSTGIYVVSITRSNGIKSSQKIVISK